MGNSDDKIEFSFFAPAGYYIALRIGFAFPVEERNALPADWVEYYTSRGLMLSDPIMRWVYENTGSTRWSEITLADPREVLTQAKAFGLNYGAVVCCQDAGKEGLRSFGSFARADREFEQSEIEVLQSALQRLHDLKAPPKNLTQAELEALGMVKNGLLVKEIAARLGVSEGAIKQRLKNAKGKLRAKNGAHAVALATEFGLI